MSWLIYHFYDESVNPVLDEYITKQEILEQYISEQTPFESYKEYEVYPDFENNNNNFGKLFDLKLGNSDATIAGFVTENRHYITNKKSFLWVLYDIISQEKDEWMRNLYKDSIKNADWEY